MKPSLRIMFKAAKSSNREVYFELGGSGKKLQTYIQQVIKYGKEYGVKVTIETKK